MMMRMMLEKDMVRLPFEFASLLAGTFRVVGIRADFPSRPSMPHSRSVVISVKQQPPILLGSLSTSHIRMIKRRKKNRNRLH